MPNDLVRWNDLLNYFYTVHPQTIEYVLDNQDRAKVRFCGNDFEIRPRPGNLAAVDIYGPAFLAQVPESIVVL